MKTGIIILFLILFGSYLTINYEGIMAFWGNLMMFTAGSIAGYSDGKKDGVRKMLMGLKQK
ncbi:hypothetical protein bas04_0082 [Escherichia phage FritzSarasin]|nr:hypothetical protein [Salmonella enterica subsp. enterica serovar 4,12:i:-]QXV79439.1 hypothetical protein bas04_0082 [Escherichia phage FritzSarasin]